MFGENFGALFALIILPILIIGLSVIMYYISRPVNEKDQGEKNQKESSGEPQ
jgi:hypothetical protein